MFPSSHPPWIDFLIFPTLLRSPLTYCFPFPLPLLPPCAVTTCHFPHPSIKFMFPFSLLIALLSFPIFLIFSLVPKFLVSLLLFLLVFSLPNRSVCHTHTHARAPSLVQGFVPRFGLWYSLCEEGISVASLRLTTSNFAALWVRRDGANEKSHHCSAMYIFLFTSKEAAQVKKSSLTSAPI